MELQEGWILYSQLTDKVTKHQSRGHKHKQICERLQCKYIDSCTQVHNQGSKTKLQAMLLLRSMRSISLYVCAEQPLSIEIVIV